MQWAIKITNPSFGVWFWHQEVSDGPVTLAGYHHVCVFKYRYQAEDFIKKELGWMYKRRGKGSWPRPQTIKVKVELREI